MSKRGDTSTAVKSAPSENLLTVLQKFYNEYMTSTPKRLKIVDAYLVYILLTGVIQFVYCALVGTFPFNSFLSGFISTVGSFVLAGRLYCNATFDELQCWNYTLAGTTAKGTCPIQHKFSYLFTNPLGYSVRECSEFGRWVRKNYTEEFLITDYSPCGILSLDDSTKQEMNDIQMLIHIYISGCLVSSVLLTVAIFVFLKFRQLRCPRVTVHINLFLSYILSNITWTIIFLDSGKPLWCYVLHALAVYTLFSNYSWMWVEGGFLFVSLAHVYSDKTKLLRVCCWFGWVFPAIVLVIYVSARIQIKEKSEEECWRVQNWTILIYLVPIAVMLLMNFVFLVKIIQILTSKLRSARIPRSSHYRKTARAVFLLSPLLGMNFILMAYKFPFFAYRFITAVLTSYQGTIVAILFCFANGEVLRQIKKNVTIFIQKRNGFQTTTQNYVAQNTTGEEYAIIDSHAV